MDSPINLSNQISVKVETKFQNQHSNNSLQEYIFSYTIYIENFNSFPVQLLLRKWIIKESNGIIKVVEGEGVIGLQPIIEPRKIFSYTSGTIIQSDIGIMYGNYTMKNTVKESLFTIKIPVFLLMPFFKKN